jgi:hypothetical protein
MVKAQVFLKEFTVNNLNPNSNPQRHPFVATAGETEVSLRLILPSDVNSMAAFRAVMEKACESGSLLLTTMSYEKEKVIEKEKVGILSEAYVGKEVW